MYLIGFNEAFDISFANEGELPGTRIARGEQGS